MRSDLRRFGQNGNIGIGDDAALGFQQFNGTGEKDARGSTLPLRITGREMRADVTLADGPQNRIGQGMHGNIGIRVTLEFLRKRNDDTTERDSLARNEGMDVDALTDTDVGEIIKFIAHHIPVGDLDILGRREFAVFVAAGNH